MDKSFGKWRGQWLNDLLARTSGDTFKVLYAVGQFLNASTRDAYPGDMLLAEVTNVSIRTVRRAIKFAEEEGFLHVTPARAQRTRLLRPLIPRETGQIVSPATEYGRERGQQSGQETGHSERASPEFSGSCPPNSRDSEDSSNTVPTSSAAFVSRTPELDHGLVDDVLAALDDNGGRMLISGLIEYMRFKGASPDGALIANMAKSGLLVRDGRYVELPKAIAA